MHNEYLRIACDTGLIGLTLFVVMLASMSWCLFSISRAARNHSLGDLPAVAFGCWCAFILLALTDNPLDYYSAFTGVIWVLIGLSYSLNANRLGRQ
jgi:O-antigen ligase